MFHQYLGSAIWRTEEEVHLRRASTVPGKKQARTSGGGKSREGKAWP